MRYRRTIGIFLGLLAAVGIFDSQLPRIMQSPVPQETIPYPGPPR